METKTDYTLGDDTINGIAISEKIRHEDLYEFNIIHRESFIDELIRWISEASKDKEVMKVDLKYLFTVEDEYIFSSVSTNEYVCKLDNNFNEICEGLLEVNNSLK